MTHCHGYRSAAVARAGPLRTIGLDAEPAQALPAKVLARIALPAELATVTELAATDPTTAFDRVLFCAKEAVFKAWYPLTRTGLGFSGAEITLRPAGGLEIIFRCETPVEVRNLTWSGRWGIEGGLTLVGVWASEESPSR
jgi:4'-phosphopantetheinyl transferase EntD